MINRNIIIITGPTASGKTEAAISLCDNLKRKDILAAVVNADSVQIYKDLKILTAQPISNKNVPHHLFGILDPYDLISVGNWRKLAETRIDNILLENKIPILCGGTGFYIDALMNGIAEIPYIPPEHRKYVWEVFQSKGRAAFFEELKSLDEEICQTLHPNNTQRILRAYEVVTFTKKPLSHWWKNKAVGKYNCLPVVLKPPKENLHRRIQQRTEYIINDAIKEVSDFLEKYPKYDGPLSKAIGLKEIEFYLNNQLSLQELIETINIKTRQYAKRQVTWFRNKISEKHVSETVEDVVDFCSRIIVN